MTSRYEIFDRQGRKVADSDKARQPKDPDGGTLGSPIVGSTLGGYGSPYAHAHPTINSRELEMLRHRADQAERKLRNLAETPLIVATVVEIRGDKMVLGCGPGGIFEVKKLGEARVGDRALVVRDTLQAVSLETPCDDETHAGTIVTVDRAGEFHVEAKLGGEPRAFRCMLVDPPKAGERVVLDPSMSFVVGNLGPPPSPLVFAPKVKVEWTDIGGQDKAKEALRDAIEVPAMYPELFKGYGKKPSKGVLLHGPPGTGKTMLAKAGATALAKIALGFGGRRGKGKTAPPASSEADFEGTSGFVYVKGPELLSGWIGKTEEAIRQVFAGAREHKAKHGYPCVVFIDECEGLLRRREEGPTAVHIATIVTQFLAEMDGMDESAALFMLATNRIEMIDPAVLRDGRVDRRVYVGRPSKADVAQIAAVCMRGVPCTEGADLPAALAEDMWRDDRIVWAMDRPGPHGSTDRLELRLRDLAAGALVAGVVNEATTIALRRDAAAGKKKPEGLRVEDVIAAIDLKSGELARQDHREAIGEMLQGRAA